MAGEEQNPNRRQSRKAAGNSSSDDDDDDAVTSESRKRRAELAASLRVFSESMLRMEMAEMEMIKAREAARLESENRRLEREVELTQLLSTTQLQIASSLFLSRSSRKRKRNSEGKEEDVEDDHSSSRPSHRERAMLLALLQCSLTL